MTRVRVATAVWALTVAIAVGSVPLAVAGDNVADAVGSLVYLSFPTVGVVVLRRLPRNPVGWYFLLGGAFDALTVFTESLSQTGYRRGWPDATLVHPAAWVQTAVWVPALLLPLSCAMLHFPDGVPPTRFWRTVNRLALGGMIGYGLITLVFTADVPTAELVQSATPAFHGWRRLLYDTSSVCLLVAFVSAIVAAGGLFVRRRRAVGVARAQLTWICWAAVVAIAAEFVNIAVGGQVLQTLLEQIGFSVIAVAAGIAITRYRLYDIDRVVSRTATYAVVTGLLIGVYVGLVTAASALVPHGSSHLGVALATLAVAALFVPLRRAVQGVVDRRFHRARFDAARTVEAFAARLRDEVDGDALHADLLATLRATVQPAHASVWIAAP